MCTNDVTAVNGTNGISDAIYVNDANKTKYEN
jgi:hypothetical protein